MDITNIYVIIGSGWTKAKIVNEIELEEYKHNFFFGQGQDYDILKREMDKAEEIWCFGDCKGYDMYSYAKEKNMEIWQMG